MKNTCFPANWSQFLYKWKPEPLALFCYEAREGFCSPYMSFLLSSLSCVVYNRTKHGLTLDFLFVKNKKQNRFRRYKGNGVRGVLDKISLCDNVHLRFCTHSPFHDQDCQKSKTFCICGKLLMQAFAVTKRTFDNWLRVSWIDKFTD